MWIVQKEVFNPPLRDFILLISPLCEGLHSVVTAIDNTKLQHDFSFFLSANHFLFPVCSCDVICTPLIWRTFECLNVLFLLFMNSGTQPTLLLICSKGFMNNCLLIQLLCMKSLLDSARNCQREEGALNAAIFHYTSGRLNILSRGDGVIWQDKGKTKLNLSCPSTSVKKKAIITATVHVKMV